MGANLKATMIEIWILGENPIKTKKIKTFFGYASVSTLKLSEGDFSETAFFSA